MRFAMAMMLVFTWVGVQAPSFAYAAAVTQVEANVAREVSLVPAARAALRDFAYAAAAQRVAKTALVKIALKQVAPLSAHPGLADSTLALTSAQDTLPPLFLTAPIDATRQLSLRFDAAQWLDARRPDVGYAATGTVVGENLGTVVWVDYAGVVSAVVQLGDTQFQLLPPSEASSGLGQGANNYRWLEVDQHQFQDHPIGWTALDGEQASHKKSEFFKHAGARPEAGARGAVWQAAPPHSLLPALPQASPRADGDTIIDVMVAYTAAARATVGGTAAMESQINLGVAQTNLAYTTSGVKQQLRLVLAYEIDYSESGNLNTDIAALRNFGDGALDELHLLRDAYGADVVSLWVDDGGGSCGIGSLMTTVAASFARSAFNVVTRSCAVGNYTFAHELGHNMGLRHDPFVDPSASPYAYAHGYVDTVNKFRTIMAYNDACVAASTSCTRIPQFSSATVLYRTWPSGNAATSNAAQALNNTRATLNAFRVKPANMAGSIQFYPQTVGVQEGGNVSLKVSRLGGSNGAASVRFQTAEQTARAEQDYLSFSGVLSWADGELGDKFIVLQTLQDNVNEGVESFSVELFDFVNAQPLLGSAVGGSRATVEIYDDETDSFPANCAAPEQGFSQPEAANAGWSVARDASTEGGCSLKSNPLPNTNVAVKAQLQFEGLFIGGTISFDRRVSSEPGFDCLRFFIDGVAVGLNGNCADVGGVGVSGNSDWARIEVPISAGNHILLWSYEKDAGTVVGADAAWIDRLVLPLQTQTAPLLVRLSAAGGDSMAGVGGTVISRTLDIVCGKKCSAAPVLGGAVKLVALPNALSIVAGWSVNGTQVCTTAQNPLVPFNGAVCSIEALALNGQTDVMVQFAPRPLRSATAAVLIASKSPSAIGDPVSLQISLAGTGPSGLLEVRRLSSNGVQVICAKVPILSGRAGCEVPLSARPAGLNIYQVYYVGDAANKEVLATIRHMVGSAPNSLTLTMEPKAPLRGQTVVLTAQVLVVADDTQSAPLSSVRAVAASGLVSFLDSAGNTVCTAPALAPLADNASIAIASCSFVPQSSPTVAQSVVARFPAGAVTVNTASATVNYATVAKVAPNYTDMWWAGEAESGWGMSIAQHGNSQFNVLYIYDSAGQPVWLVMPGGTWNTEQTEYSGVVYQPQSSPYYAYKTSPDTTAVLPLNVGKPVGQVTLKFLSQKTASFSYTINGVTGTKNIERQVFGAAVASGPRLPVNDLWWGGAAENGWGLNLAQQGNTVFGVWYTYNAQGDATWYVMPGGKWEGNAYTGALYSTQATSWLGGAYNANFFRATPVGNLRLDFYDANLALMQVELPSAGFLQSRVLVRQGF